MSANLTGTTRHRLHAAGLALALLSGAVAAAEAGLPWSEEVAQAPAAPPPSSSGLTPEQLRRCVQLPAYLVRRDSGPSSSSESTAGMLVATGTASMRGPLADECEDARYYGMLPQTE